MIPNQKSNDIKPLENINALDKTGNLNLVSNQNPKHAVSVSELAFDTNIVAANNKKKVFQKIKDNIKIIIICFSVMILVVLTLMYVITPIEVSGISMEPTFHTGNYCLVYKWPQTWANLTGSQYIPGRGQVMIVNDTNNNGELFIKRVIGLPGDNVNVTDGIVKIMNSNNQKGFNPDKVYPYGKTLSLYQPGMNFEGNVANGQIFVMGDNRVPGASIDSRSSMGDIPSSYITGRVLVKFWPINQIKLF